MECFEREVEVIWLGACFSGDLIEAQDKEIHVIDLPKHQELVYMATRSGTMER